MSYSFTSTETKTFTLTHARHLAAKVATDLHRLKRLYGGLSDERIAKFEAEITELLKLGYLGTVTYGFKRNDQWIEPTLKYTATELLYGNTDDDPGRVRPGMNIDGASFYSYLTYSSAWHALSTEQKSAIEKQLPIQRGTASEPQVNGYFSDDKTYSSGGRSLGRSSVRSF